MSTLCTLAVVRRVSSRLMVSTETALIGPNDGRLPDSWLWWFFHELRRERRDASGWFGWFASTGGDRHTHLHVMCRKVAVSHRKRWPDCWSRHTDACGKDTRQHATWGKCETFPAQNRGVVSNNREPQSCSHSFHFAVDSPPPAFPRRGHGSGERLPKIPSMLGCMTQAKGVRQPPPRTSARSLTAYEWPSTSCVSLCDKKE
jgi:hypothetical protein